MLGQTALEIVEKPQMHTEFQLQSPDSILLFLFVHLVCR